MPHQAMPSNSPALIASCTRSQGSVTGTTPNRVRKRPAVGKVKMRFPRRSASARIGSTVRKWQGSQEPALIQVTPVRA